MTAHSLAGVKNPKHLQITVPTVQMMSAQIYGLLKV